MAEACRKCWACLPFWGLEAYGLLGVQCTGFISSLGVSRLGVTATGNSQKNTQIRALGSNVTYFHDRIDISMAIFRIQAPGLRVSGEGNTYLQKTCRTNNDKTYKPV